MGDFIQAGPVLGNQYEDDLLLKDWLKRKLPSRVLDGIENDLSRFGERVVEECLPLARKAENEPPRLVRYSPWGERVDEIVVSDAWRDLNDIAAAEGLISIGYRREQQEFSRPFQFAKLYLYHPSSAIYTCPLAMTDGAARLIEAMGETENLPRAYKSLTSSDPKSFWTSGQWMTEKTGGSDVRKTRTVAKRRGDSWELTGIKWFSSATTSQMAMTLAREDREDGPLSLFYLETRREDGSLNGIEVLRLKDKLGTKALPTAELRLAGAKASRIGESGKGVRNISHLFNVSRVYNALTAVANMRRMLALTLDYAKKREAFGKRLIDHGPHRQTLFEKQAEFIGCFHLVFRCAELMGSNETGKGGKNGEKLLRLLTPVAKLYTAKRGIEVVSELLESFGGAGYVEDTGIPVILRDAQVLSIWEGTTNVLALDVLRSIVKEDALSAFFEDAQNILDRRKKAIDGDADLDQAFKRLSLNAKKLIKDQELFQTAARDFSFALAHVYTACQLREAVDETDNGKAGRIYQRTFAFWCLRLRGAFFKDVESYRNKIGDFL